MVYSAFIATLLRPVHKCTMVDSSTEPESLQNGSANHRREEIQHKRQASQSTSPIDGKWAVVVAIGAFFCRALMAGQSSSMPIITVEWEKRLGASPDQVSWASTLVAAARFCTAPIAGALNRKFGCRPIVFGGGILASFFTILLSFVNELWQIYLCCGLIGMATGLVYQGAVIIVGVYCDKWLARANGVAYGGVGLGIIAGPPLMALLIMDYTWRGTVLILAGIIANICVVASVFRPLSWWVTGRVNSLTRSRTDIQARDTEETYEMLSANDVTFNEPPRTQSHVVHVDVYESNQEQSGNGQNSYFHEGELQTISNASDAIPTLPIEVQYARHSNNDVITTLEPREMLTIHGHSECSVTEHSFEEGQNRYKQCGLLGAFANLFGFSLIWTNPNVFLLCLANMFSGGGYTSLYVYLASYAVDSGISELNTSFILTVLGACSLVARFTHGFLIDFRLITSTKLYGVSAIIGGLSTVLLISLTTYPAFIGFAVVFGLSSGVYIPLAAVLVKVYTSGAEVASAFALSCLFTGIGQFIGVYLQGVIFTSTKSYVGCFILNGVMLSLSGVTSLLIESWNTWLNRRKKKLDTENESK